MTNDFFARTREVHRRSVIFAFMAALACGAGWMAPASGARASALTTLYSFCADADNGCPDGARPFSLLAHDGNGNLYGTTQTGGGAAQGGTVFELERQTNGGFKFHLLHAFCESDCADGSGPFGDLIIDVDGNLYGMTLGGGTGNAGTVYKLTRGVRQWRFSTLLTFNKTNGFEPMAQLSYHGAQTGAPYDGKSPLFGTAYRGGKHGAGLVFLLTSKNKTYMQTILYQFCAAKNCRDGVGPAHGVLVDAAGNLFGATDTGGDADHGVVFELSPVQGSSPDQVVYSETTLYSFCRLANCADGASPGPIAFDSSGNLVGTTFTGGTHDLGTAFRVTPNGKASHENVLYSFCSQASCSDGSAPYGHLAIDAHGSVFGITASGGAFNNGALFKIQGKTESVPYSFCALSGCTDGSGPDGGIFLDEAGNVFGVTRFGGAHNSGSVFQFAP